MKCNKCGDDSHKYTVMVGLNKEYSIMKPWCIPCLINQADEDAYRMSIAQENRRIQERNKK